MQVLATKMAAKALAKAADRTKATTRRKAELSYTSGAYLGHRGATRARR